MTGTSAQLTSNKPYGAFAPVRNLTIAASVLFLLPGLAAAEVRILAFGDSLTQGYGLPDGEGFVPQMEAWLHENGADDAVLVNGGVSGDTTAGGLSRIDWSLDDSVDGVIVALGGNDLLRGISVGTMRENLDGILSAIAERDLPVVLAGLPAPSNYGAEYQEEFRDLYPSLAEEHGATHYPSFIAAINQDNFRELMQGDGIHPNADGVSANVELMGPVVLDLVERARD
ncbi:arylesterase [Amaricoccus tamworthensis]|uniref:arylesterase n=1 Tax=Amaricoccus tamworthensis TaxID=57002 RepID=UPI003C79AB14